MNNANQAQKDSILSTAMREEDTTHCIAEGAGIDALLQCNAHQLRLRNKDVYDPRQSVMSSERGGEGARLGCV